MSGRYLVDTSAWIFALRRRPNEAIRSRIHQLLGKDLVATCGVVELELVAGARNEGDIDRIRMRLLAAERFLVDESDWADAAHLGYSVRRKGVTVGAPDLMLAAIAIRHNVVLLHADRDFDLLAAHTPLRVESMVEFTSPGKE